MSNHALVATGAVGAILAVVCCAAPWLVASLAAFSLVGAAAWSGRALIAVIVVLAVLAGYRFYHRHRMAACTPPNEGTEPDDR